VYVFKTDDLALVLNDKFLRIALVPDGVSISKLPKRKHEEANLFCLTSESGDLRGLRYLMAKRVYVRLRGAIWLDATN
jgi:hypothetical protein